MGGSIDIWYQRNSNSWVQHENDLTTSGDYWTSSIGVSSFGSGDSVDFKANYSGGSATKAVTVDEGGPNTFTLETPSETTNDDSPTVEVSVSDDLSGVKNISFNVEDSDNNEEDSKDCSSDSCSVDLSDLDDEDYDVEITSYDNKNNTNSEAKTFTVDTSYDGDTSPSFDWDSSVNDGIILMDDDEELTLGFDDDDEEPDTVSCYEDYDDSDDKGDEIDSDSNSDTNDGEYEYECDFDEDDYSGEEVDLTIEFCDVAGNCDTFEHDDSPFVFDAEGPNMAELSTSVTSVNGDFEVDYTATDESGIDQLEYFFDEDTDVGDGNNVSQDDSEGSFTVDISSLESGENTVYVRAKDQAGRWGDSKSLTFDYLPNKEPEVGLTVPSEMTVTAGESDDFEVMIQNSGELLVEDVNISVSGDIVSGSDSIDSLFPGESTNKTFELDAGEDHIGARTVTVESDSPSESDSFDVRVEANQNQRTEIESKLSEYQTKMNDLSENAESKKDGIRKNLYANFESNFTDFKSKVEAAEQEVQDGQYYKAQSSLEGIEDSYKSADSSFQNVVEVDQKKDRQQMIMFAVLGLLVLGGSAGAFMMYSDDYGLNLGRLYDSDIDINGFEDLKTRISSMFSSEEEAEEFEWNGFE